MIKTINSIMSGQGEKLISLQKGKVILHGVGKKKIKAHTINQVKIVDAFIKTTTWFFCYWPGRNRKKLIRELQ